MTKILNTKQFINEAYGMTLTRTVDDSLILEQIITKCTWTGEHWYFYDREKKGSIEDFKALKRNKNENVEFLFKMFFKMEGERNGETEELNNAIVSVHTVVHWHDMAANDYSIDVKYIEGMEEFAEMLSEYTVDTKELSEVIADTWDEDSSAKEDVSNEMNDRIGTDPFDKILEEIKTETVKGFVKDYEDKR